MPVFCTSQARSSQVKAARHCKPPDELVALAAAPKAACSVPPQSHARRIHRPRRPLVTDLIPPRLLTAGAGPLGSVTAANSICRPAQRRCPRIDFHHALLQEGFRVQGCRACCKGSQCRQRVCSAAQAALARVLDPQARPARRGPGADSRLHPRDEIERCVQLPAVHHAACTNR